MDKINIILEHTRLVKEYGCLPMNANSKEEYKPIQERREQIIKRINELKIIEGKW